MQASTLRDLLAPFIPAAELDDPMLASIAIHLDLLIRWNQRINLTALRSPEEMVVRHFGESLFAARALFPRDARPAVSDDAASDLSVPDPAVFDLGSGAGFPGLPIKYWAPQVQLTLIESHGKKATFLREVGRSLQLTGFSVLNLRAESLSATNQCPTNQRATLVTMRAVEKFDRALVAASRLVAPGGRLAVLIGQAQHQRAISLLPPGESSTLSLPSSEQRILLTWKPTT
jgi:16S rRNA (guanine527-N7)-methyltransferase